MNLKRVVVTGLGSLTPIGNDVSSTWASLVAGASGAGAITRFDPSLFKCKIACEVKGFNSLDFFDRKEVRKHDLFSQYGMVVADEAIADAGLGADKVDCDRVGVIFATGMGGVNSFQNECFDFQKGNGVPRFSPFFVPRVIGDICAGHISIKYGFSGPNYSTSAACASSAIAIANAFDLIRLGRADVVVAGGSEAAITPTGIGGFSAMQALSTRNEDPQSASRPFDKDRDGFVLGDGAGALILEELEHAKARGAKIYAELTGVGLTADAHHITAPHPDGKGAMNAMRLAVEESGMRLCDVDHINTHGTSTPVGDLIEPKAVVSLFGDHANRISLCSTKSMTGHLLGAAGAVEAVATVLSLQHNIVPPTINHFADDPDLPMLDYTFNAPRHRELRFALSNAFGFGGHNVCLAFRKY
ncbi:MAG: beta-ketoacyl-ACP synthase II [Bacteroidales bacterium]|nr:beta-ketoacyl-ACP synthase II [Candidatus Colimorpha onthohippi]